MRDAVYVRRLTLTVGALVCSVLAGCEWVDRVRLGGEERINRASPPPASVLQAVDRARAELKSAPPSLTAFDSDYSGLMRVRAVECAKGYSPSLHHSDAEIRERLDATCLAKRDAELAQWIGMWRVGAIARLPALVQPGSGHVPSVNMPTDIQRLWFADRAAVMLAQLAQGTAQVIDLMTGRVIWSSAQQGNHFFGPLSPNGRMFAWSDGAKVLVRHAETGETLAELPKANAYSVQWLGSHGLLLDRDGEPGGPLVLDFRRREQFNATTRWRAVPASGNEDEFVLMSFDRFSRVRFADAPAPPGLVTIDSRPAVLQEHTRFGLLTADGHRLVEHVRGQAVVVTELSTLEGQRVETAPLYVEQALPAPNADQVVVQGYIGNVNRRSTYLLSLPDRTLAEVDIGVSSGRGGLQFVGVLGKIGSFYGRELRFHDATLTKALRRLDALAAEELASANQQKLDALAKALAAGSSPDDSSVLAPKMQSGGTLAGITPEQGTIARLARDAVVEAVGVYQGPRGNSPSGTETVIEVRVRRSSRPLVLVLSAYETVRWNLLLEPGAQLAAVLTSGYQDQSVSGAGGARVVAIGQAYAYQRQGAVELEREVYRVTGKPISLFQGKYEGRSFTVGGS